MDDHVVITKVQSTNYSPGVNLNKDYTVDKLHIKYDCLVASNPEGQYVRTSIIKKIEVIEDYQMKVHTFNSVYLLSFLAKAKSILFKSLIDHELVEN